MQRNHISCSLLFTLLLVGSNASAQIDTASLFYPIREGNLWQYRSQYFYSIGWTLFPGDVVHYTLEVAGDTTLPNGRSYQMVQNRNTGEPVLYAHPWFQRIDSLTSCVFAFDTSEGGRELLIDTLGLTNGSFFGSRIGLPTTNLIKIDTQMVFGVPRLCRTYITGLSDLRHQWYTIAAGVGVIWSLSAYQGYDMADGPRYIDSLVYARIDGLEYGTLVGVFDSQVIPKTTMLHSNYPNPFNPSTTIRWELSQNDEVRLSVYDVLGREIAILFQGFASAGTHTTVFDAMNLGSGVYICTLRCGPESISKKIILTK